MSSLADLPELVGFFSYSREDDTDSHGALSALRTRIQGELRGQLGRTAKTFRLWQDKEAIAAGALWESEIRTAVAQSAFFIPIITPTVVASPYCRFELESFLAREAELGRNDLVFPVLYIDVPALEDAARRQNDPVLSLIAERQYLDWRKLRHRDVRSTEVSEAVEQFCTHVRDALHRASIPAQQRKTEAAEAAPLRERDSDYGVPIRSRLRWRSVPAAASLIGVAALAAIAAWLAGTLPIPVSRPVPAAAVPALADPQQVADAPLTLQSERALTPKSTFRECDDCPLMIVVPAGHFTIGSPASEPERFGEEGPQHAVTFAAPLAVGQFAVTFDEWDACVADGGCNGYRPADQGWGRGRMPAINVSWDDAKAYVAWLSRKTGKTYRLLTEAEREYVTRAGTTTPFWWGNSISTSQANYNGDDTYADGAKGVDRERTLPVDAFAPNPWGLYQVHGNLWEWTEDCWHESYRGAPSDGSAWTLAGDCANRVARGGSWFVSPIYLRSAERLWYSPDLRDSYLGFLVARTLLAP